MMGSSGEGANRADLVITEENNQHVTRRQPNTKRVKQNPRPSIYYAESSLKPADRGPGRILLKS